MMEQVRGPRSEVRGGEATIASFEDLVAWQKARTLTASVYRVTGSDAFGRDFGLRDQARRAAVSIMANIAEGYERGGSVEYVRYLSMAKASCAEVCSHLYVAFDAGHLDRADFERLLADVKEVGRIIAGLRAAIARTSDLGPRTSR